MPKEVERRFAVRDPSIILGHAGARIIQGYIADLPMTVRVRIIDADAYVTLKGKTVGIERDEYEMPLPLAQAAELLDRYCGSRVIVKTRYRISYQRQVFEVDVFEGRLSGLILAEIELDRPDQPVAFPGWIGAELSHDHRFSNSALSLAESVPPLPEACPAAA